MCCGPTGFACSPPTPLHLFAFGSTYLALRGTLSLPRPFRAAPKEASVTRHQLPKSKASCCEKTTALGSYTEKVGITLQTYYVDIGSSGSAGSLGRSRLLKSIVSFPPIAHLQMISRNRDAALYALNILIAWQPGQLRAATNVGEMALNYRIMQMQHCEKIGDTYKCQVVVALS